PRPIEWCAPETRCQLHVDRQRPDSSVVPTPTELFWESAVDASSRRPRRLGGNARPSTRESLTRSLLKGIRLRSRFAWMRVCSFPRIGAQVYTTRTHVQKP